jgi:hypothetical protein
MADACGHHPAGWSGTVTRWTVAVGAVLAGCLAADAAAGESVATALRLGADTPELRQLAEHWRGHRAELLARLALPDPEERQGAARLCALVGVGDGMTAAALLAALVASSDGEVRRLGTYGLLDHLDGIPPARLLALGDAALVCQLLGAYPSRDALADLAVQKQLVAWLHDPAACDAVAVLITIQGNAQTWGPQLVEVIEAAAKEPDSPVQQHLVATAHQALCVLTRTQRGLAPYAGYYDLLAKDWRDALAEKPALASGPADADLLALIRALPGPASVRALLGRGSSVLPALEQAMIGADRQRRTQLQAAARLVARAVSPSLYDDLGDAGLEGMDADSVAERLKALARAAEAVLRTADAPGLVHLVTYLDDHDTVVRTAALDRLVRLSDEHKRFHDHWTLEEKGNFPPGPCLWRLRRSLKLGGRDEQVAALQFTASLRANELSDDVVALLLSPSPMVVETALETLGHLQAIAHVAMLMRLAGDRSQPAPRRARILELITRMLSQNSNDAATKASDEVARSVQQLLAAETDTLVLGAARKAQFQTARTPKEQRDALLAMLGKGGSDRAAALRLLAEHAVATEHNRTSGGNRPPLLIIDLALPYLFDGDRDTAVLAAEALVEAMDNRKRSTEIAALFTQAMRADLVQWCTHHEGAWPGHLALAATLRAIPRPQLIALVRGLTGDDVAMPWLALIASATDAQAVLDEVLAAEGAGAQIGEHALNTLITTVLGAGLLHPAQLKAVLAIGAFDLLPGGQDSSTETNYGQNGQGYTATRVIALPDGETLRLAGTKRKGDETEYGDSSFDWTSQPPGADRLPGSRGLRPCAHQARRCLVVHRPSPWRDLAPPGQAGSHPAAAARDRGAVIERNVVSAPVPRAGQPRSAAHGGQEPGQRGE